MSASRYTRPDNFPPVVKNLLIINGLVFLGQMVFQESFNLTDKIALYPVESSEFRPYQLVTHMFAHSTNTFFHILFNMFGLWMFGRILESFLGSKRFLILYLVSGLAAALFQLGIQYVQYDYNEVYQQAMEAYFRNDRNSAAEILSKIAPMVGASGAVMGVFAAFAYLFPNTELFFMFIPVPIKAKYAIPGLMALDLFGAISRVPGDNVAHWAHLGGAAAGFLIVLFWNKTNRSSFY